MIGRSSFAVVNRYRPRWLWRLRQVLGRPRLLAVINRLWLRLIGYPRVAAYPREILIETATRCNAHCRFCPVNADVDPRPLQFMAEVLLDKLLAELVAANYAGEIDFFLHNEPLIDRRLEDICARFRSSLPHAALVVFTNGKLLTTDRYRALMQAGVDLLCINAYGDDCAPAPALLALLACNDADVVAPGGRTLLRVRLADERLSNRAGQAPNAPGPVSASVQAAGCIKPYEQFAIRVDGKVSLCCNDALGRTSMGDLNRQSIAEIWAGSAFAGARRELASAGRRGVPLCAGCDAELLPLSNDFKRRMALAVTRLRAG